MRRILFILFLLPLETFSQNAGNDTVIHLSEVEITSWRLNKLSTGLNKTIFDSLTLDLNENNSLSTLISSSTPNYIRTYGPGNLSSVSLRGTSSAHTGVYWNGIKLNPPNIDMEDLSLYPVSFFGNVEMLAGGAASLFGSGNIGGSVHLQNKPAFKKNFTADIGVSAGSFNDYRANGNITVSNKKIWSSTKFAYKNAKNDFQYESPDGEEVKRTNAAQEQYGFMQDFFAVLSKESILGASLWYQSAGRQIPGSMQVPQSDAKQNDNSFRALLQYKKTGRKVRISAKTAFMHSYLSYVDMDTIPQLQIDNEIITNTGIAGLSANFFINNRITATAGADFRYDQCSTPAYQSTPDRKNTGLFLSVNYKIPKIEWDFTVNLRQDFFDNYGTPFSPSFGLEGKIVKCIFGKVNISRNFRMPTFNDLYWYPYGNTGLVPERSWNEEATIILKDEKTSKYQLSLTGFNTVIDDYILWIPVSGNLWSPENIQTVRARGIEANGSTNIMIGKVLFKINAGYSYTRSTNEKQTGANDNSSGKQLIYLPVNNFNGNFTFLYKGFVINYRQSFTGLRYITRDNSDYLPAYNTGDIIFSKTVKLGKFGIKLQFNIFNLYNTEYQSVAYYPMPGRNYRLSLLFKLK